MYDFGIPETAEVHQTTSKTMAKQFTDKELEHVGWLVLQDIAQHKKVGTPGPDLEYRQTLLKKIIDAYGG